MVRPVVVVVSYRTPERLEACLDAIRADDADARIYLVDHESDSQRLAEVVRGREGVIAMPYAENHGFAGGVNRGVERAWAAGATHVLLLNDDMRIRPGCIQRLVGAAGESGAASPWVAGEGEAAYRGGKIDWTLGYAGHEEGADDYLLGGCMLISPSAWEQVGPFDESYFLYCEDVDWSIRAREAGVPLLVVPEELADHDGGASTGAGESATWAYWWTRNRLRIVRRYGDRSVAPVALRQVGRAAKDVPQHGPRVAWARLRGAAAGVLVRS